MNSTISTHQQKFYGKYGKPVNVFESDDFYALSNPNLLSKACIKHDGHKWTIHKIDVDPFPSKPYAHDYENHTKLHLGNGNLYTSYGKFYSLTTEDIIILTKAFFLNLASFPAGNV